MKIELTDEEVTTILVALDNYGAQKRIEWLDSRDDDDLTEAGSSEWCWQKLFAVQQEFRNSIADAIGEGEQPPTTIDPFTLPTWTD
jgi:hypothetical protein|tara:strand:- start:627 stop:884 length:258 start_codon:yes stop_codon:yes gene_type:complete